MELKPVEHEIHPDTGAKTLHVTEDMLGNLAYMAYPASTVLIHCVDGTIFELAADDPRRTEVIYGLRKEQVHAYAVDRSREGDGTFWKVKGLLATRRYPMSLQDADSREQALSYMGVE